MSEEIKNTAITAAGYIYQNRQGLRLLCDWLDAPTRFTRVKFECDDEAVAPKGLDDIVAERADDLIDLEQVKYTPNPGSEGGTLGAVLKKLEKVKKLHPAMKSAFSSLYGYSSDADGIRHALLEESQLTKADARFMLVCCSAFINYSLEAVGT